MLKVLVLGHSGQLATSLRERLSETIFASRYGPIKIDLLNTGTIFDRISAIEPDIVINAAGMTSVDECEYKKDEAYLVNGISLREIARYCIKKKIKLIHVSTDYVFDGKVGNYSEDSIPNPINFYGLSKLIGDTYAISCDDSVVVRTSGVFGMSKNFPIFVLERLSKGEKVFTINGYYSPIFAGILAAAIEKLLHTDYKGLLNVAGERTSREIFAKRIADKFSLDRELIVQSDGQINFVAKRPFDSSLNIDKAQKILNFDFFSMDKNLNEFYENLRNIRNL